MSVDIEELILAVGGNPATHVTTPKYIGSVRFPVSAARSAELLVGYDPLPDNQCHGEVWGTLRPNRFSKTQQRALLAASTWLVKIPDAEIAD